MYVDRDDPKMDAGMSSVICEMCVQTPESRSTNTKADKGGERSLMPATTEHLIYTLYVHSSVSSCDLERPVTRTVSLRPPLN